jgi:hypothetical protein
MTRSYYRLDRKSTLWKFHSRAPVLTPNRQSRMAASSDGCNRMHQPIGK